MIIYCFDDHLHFISFVYRILQSFQSQVLSRRRHLGKNDEEHMANVKEVVKRLEEAGFRCRVDKSQFMQKSVIYLGHEVST